MNKLTSTLLVCAALLAVLGGGLFLYDKYAGQLQPQTVVATPPAVSETDEPGEMTSSDTEGSVESVFAPDFTVYDADGNAVRLSDFRGKPVILNFWATWCGYCKQHMPHFESAYQDIGNDVHILMVNLTGGQETVETAHDFIVQNDYHFPVYYDTSYSAAIAYGANAIPVTFFIDAEGYPVAYAQGALSAEMLRTGIDMIYSE